MFPTSSGHNNALLSPRDCERFVWNRSVNNKGSRGKNILLDLEVEHSNLFNKAAIRNLGANVTEKAVQRISFSEGGTANITAGVEESLNRLIGSGRHTSSSTDRDLGELIKRAVLTKVFTEVPNRQYQHFQEFGHVCIVQLDKSTQEKCTMWQQGTMSNLNGLNGLIMYFFHN